MAVDIKALARSQYDPLTMNGQYRAEKKRLRDAMSASTAAEGAAFGSIAARNDPTRSGSLASRRNPGLFKQEARALHAPQYDNLAPVEQPTLRREVDKTPFNLDDLSDEDFLASLGLNLGSLRRGGV